MADNKNDTKIDLYSDEYEDIKDIYTLCKSMNSNVRMLNETKKDEEITKLTTDVTQILKKVFDKQAEMTNNEAKKTIAELSSLFNFLERTYERMKIEQR